MVGLSKAGACHLQWNMVPDQTTLGDYRPTKVSAKVRTWEAAEHEYLMRILLFKTRRLKHSCCQFDLKKGARLPEDDT